MSSTQTNHVDVLVVGAGNAALSAALAAKEAGASVRVIERAPEALRGGNSRFTGGMVRFAYDDVQQLREVATDTRARLLRRQRRTQRRVARPHHQHINMVRLVDAARGCCGSKHAFCRSADTPW